MLLLLSTLCFSVAAGQHTRRRGSPAIPVGTRWEEGGEPLPSTANCSVLYLKQPLDHFSFTLEAEDAAASASQPKTFMQRYYVYDKYWKHTTDKNAPIFFYVGNEADVGLYVNATGLMWENAKSFGALLVFAEHRFYGASLPKNYDTTMTTTTTNKANQSTTSPVQHPYLSHELALADYAVLIETLRRKMGAASSPVIAFGGSYGGKLAAWLRMKYPSAVAGAISASAPLLGFKGEEPSWDSESYYRVVTNTATHYSPHCSSNIRAAFPLLEKEGATAAGRTALKDAFRLCETPATAYKVEMLRFFIRDAFDELAMGNYPFQTSYIAGDAQHLMPAWPAKEACSFLSDPTLAGAAETLFPAIRQAVSVLYNVTEDQECYELPDYPTPTTAGSPMDGIWDWQWCTEQMPDSYWFSTDGVKDMFWSNPYNQTLVDEHCKLFWGTTARLSWVRDEYGGRGLGRGRSNIVFSSGGYDGWSSAGVATNITSQSLTSLLIPNGGHHLDLMFSHTGDPASVVAVREHELAAIQDWVAAFNDAYAHHRLKSWGDEL